MKKQFRSALFLLCLCFLFTSCKLKPFLRYYTVLKDGKYPHFNRFDRLTGSINDYRSCYDVTFYKFDIRPDIPHKRISGGVEITYTNLSDYTTLLLDLHPTLKVKSISCKGSKISYRHKRNALFVTFSETQKKGSSATLTISYEGKPVKLLGHCAVNWKEDTDKKPWVNTLCQGLGASMIWPCKDLLYDEADSMSMRIHVPKGSTGISNGRLISKTETEKEDVYDWTCRNTINVYNISFAIGNYKELVFPYTNASGTHDLKVFVLPANEERAKEHFKQLIPEMAFLENLYGEYPWYNDGYKIFESPHSGAMEHQSAIALGNHFGNNGWGFDDLIVHETSHEWWGNSMTAKDYDDIWLHEGFATFSEYLYMEHLKGNAFYRNVMGWYMNTNNKAVGNKVPVIKLPDVRYSAWIAPRDGDIYIKGGIVLHSLRSVIDNDSLFFGLLRSFYQQHLKSNITTKQFIAHVNATTGKDYNWFFKQYLYNYKVPELNYYFTKDAEGDVFHYCWKNTVSDFIIPIQGTTTEAPFYLYPTQQWQELKMKDRKAFTLNTSFVYYSVKQIKT